MKVPSVEKRMGVCEVQLRDVVGELISLKKDVSLLKRFKQSAGNQLREIKRFKDHVYVMIDELAISLEQVTWQSMRLKQSVDQYHTLYPAK